MSTFINDGFVKSPSAALPCILRHCGVLSSTPHSSGFGRLASGAFYIAIQQKTFYEIIKNEVVRKTVTNCRGNHAMRVMVAHIAGGHLGPPLQYPVWFRLSRVREAHFMGRGGEEE